MMDWIFLNMEKKTLVCLRCKVEQQVIFPIAVSDMVTLCRVFERQHKDCRRGQ